jgi:hypothetical protein
MQARGFSGEEQVLWSSKPGHYGGFGDEFHANRAFLARGQRQRIDMYSVMLCLFVPWLLFVLVYALVSFKLHFLSSALCWGSAALALLLVVVAGGFAARSMYRKLTNNGIAPNWYAFLFLTMVIAWVMGAVLGQMVFWTYMQPYYMYASMHQYTGVDPLVEKGASYMDGGRITFVDNATLDLGRSMGFKNEDTYCVAPVSLNGDTTAGAFDFWAVGLGCCSGNANDFHCGAYADTTAHAGLRLLTDEQRPFFRLAVRQAEAAYAIKANHPLFVYFVADPDAEMAIFAEQGTKWFLLGMLVHFGWQCLAVGLAARGFAKLGHF